MSETTRFPREFPVVSLRYPTDIPPISLRCPSDFPSYTRRDGAATDVRRPLPLPLPFRHNNRMATSSDPIPAALSIEGLNTPDARASFSLASTCGYRGIGFATNHPELNPESLGPSARRHVKTILAAQHLTVESVRAAAPRAGLADSATIDRTLENARKAMLLARELGVRTVSLNIGKLGDSSGAVGGAGGGSIPEGTIVSALRELAQQADASGLTLALAADGGVESLLRVLKAVDFDRARLELSGGRVIGAGEDAAEDCGGGGGGWE